MFKRNRIIAGVAALVMTAGVGIYSYAESFGSETEILSVVSEGNPYTCDFVPTEDYEKVTVKLVADNDAPKAGDIVKYDVVVDQKVDTSSLQFHFVFPEGVDYVSFDMDGDVIKNDLAYDEWYFTEDIDETDNKDCHDYMFVGYKKEFDDSEAGEYTFATLTVKVTKDQPDDIVAENVLATWFDENCEFMYTLEAAGGEYNVPDYEESGNNGVKYIPTEDADKVTIKLVADNDAPKAGDIVKYDVILDQKVDTSSLQFHFVFPEGVEFVSFDMNEDVIKNDLAFDDWGFSEDIDQETFIGSSDYQFMAYKTEFNESEAGEYTIASLTVKVTEDQPCEVTAADVLANWWDENGDLKSTLTTDHEAAEEFLTEVEDIKYSYTDNYEATEDVDKVKLRLFTNNTSPKAGDTVKYLVAVDQQVSTCGLQFNFAFPEGMEFESFELNDENIRDGLFYDDWSFTEEVDHDEFPDSYSYLFFGGMLYDICESMPGVYPIGELTVKVTADEPGNVSIVDLLGTWFNEEYDVLGTIKTKSDDSDETVVDIDNAAFEAELPAAPAPKSKEAKPAAPASKKEEAKPAAPASKKEEAKPAAYAPEKDETKPEAAVNNAAEVVYALGDVDGTGKITSHNIIKVAAHVKGIKRITDPQSLKAADTDANGKINGNDIVKIAAHIKGIKKLK